MDVLLVGSKAREISLAKCQICESILAEHTVQLDGYEACPVCENIIMENEWYAKSSAEYEELEKEVQLYSI